MPRAPRLLIGWLLRTAVLYGLWLALVDNVHTSELLTGVAAAALAAALATRTQTLGESRMRPRPAMLLCLPAGLLSLVTDTVRVTIALLRALAGRHAGGRFRAVAYAATGESPTEAGHRALTELAGSLGPNRVVLGIDRDRGVLLVHELVPCTAPLDPVRHG